MMSSRSTYSSCVASAHAAMTLHLKKSYLVRESVVDLFVACSCGLPVQQPIARLLWCSDLTLQQCLDECALKEMCMYAYVEKVCIGFIHTQLKLCGCMGVWITLLNVTTTLSTKNMCKPDSVCSDTVSCLPTLSTQMPLRTVATCTLIVCTRVGRSITAPPTTKKVSS